MGFIRQQEERLAIRLLIWQYQKMNISIPAIEELEHQAANLVEDAHRIARERGRNIMSILKEMIADIKNKKKMCEQCLRRKSCQRFDFLMSQRDSTKSPRLIKLI